MERDVRSVNEVGIMESPLPEVDGNMSDQEDHVSIDEGKGNHSLKVTDSGTPLALPSEGFHTNTGGAFTPTPSTYASASAFCTSSDDVMTAFDFSKENNEDSAGYERVDDENSPKVTLVSGDLFRRVCLKPAYIAKILLEPQNKVHLNNFLEGFSGTKAVLPWAVGASLKHWAAKLTLFEEEEIEMLKVNLPYLKTTQPVADIGNVVDVKAMEQLTEVVKTYLQKLDDEEQLSQVAKSFDSLVNFIQNVVNVGESEDTAEIPTQEFTLQRPVNPQQNIREAFEDLINEVRQAEIEIQEIEARVAIQPQIPQPDFLHRIAGFKSFLGAFGSGSSVSPPAPDPSQLTSRGYLPGTGSTSSMTQLTASPPLVFPKKSGIFSGAYATPSKLFFSDSTQRLDSNVSITLLASSASRPQLPVRADDNGNPLPTFVETNTREPEDEESNVGFFGSAVGGAAASNVATQSLNDALDMTTVEVDAAIELSKGLWNEDSSTLALVSELEELARKQQVILSNPTSPAPSHVCIHGVEESQPEAPDHANPREEAQSPPEASIPPLTQPQAQEKGVETKSKGKPVQVATKPGRGPTLSQWRPKVDVKGKLPPSQLQAKKTVPTPRLILGKTPLHSIGQEKSKLYTPTPKVPTSSSPIQKSGQLKPPVGRKVETTLRKPPFSFATKAYVTTPKPTPAHRRVDEPRLAQGCRRIEFTKVKQTSSYRQLNKANLLLLQTSKGRSADDDLENSSPNNNPLPNDGRGPAVECDSQTLPQRMPPDVVSWTPLSEDDATTSHDLGILRAPRGTYTPPLPPTEWSDSASGSSPSPLSKLTSTSKLKSSLSSHGRSSLGYVGLRLQKKVFEDVVEKMTVGTPRVGILPSKTSTPPQHRQ